METDLSFYLRRAEEERLAAERAIAPGARQAHQALADTYARKARTLEPDEIVPEARERLSLKSPV